MPRTAALRLAFLGLAACGQGEAPSSGPHADVRRVAPREPAAAAPADYAAEAPTPAPLRRPTTSVMRPWTTPEHDGVAQASTFGGDTGVDDRFAIACIWSIPDARGSVRYEIATTPPTALKDALQDAASHDLARSTRLNVEGVGARRVFTPRRVELDPPDALFFSRGGGERVISINMIDGWPPDGRQSPVDQTLLRALSTSKRVTVEIDLAQGRRLSVAFTGAGAAQALKAANCRPAFYSR